MNVLTAGTALGRKVKDLVKKSRTNHTVAAVVMRDTGGVQPAAHLSPVLQSEWLGRARTSEFDSRNHLEETRGARAGDDPESRRIKDCPA